VYKVVDTVDNFRSPGDDEQNRPPAVRREPPIAPSSRAAVPKPGDELSGTAGRSAAAGRGSDIAREALRAAREASAERTAQRSAERQGRKPAVGRGRRRRWSGPGPDDRDPQPFGRLVSRVSLDRGWSPRLTDATVLGRWPNLVGSEIADHCTPLSLRDGELVLQAESTAWATQLRTLQRQLLVRLAAAVGKDVVRRIRVVAPSGPSWRHGPRSVRGRGPRDTYG
jgi:predicted nucleic acid-binding Zn ribbon protein